MIKHLLLFVFLGFSISSFGQWSIYDASVLPLDTMFAGSCNEPGTDFSENIIADPDIAGNTLLEYISPGDNSKQAYKVNPDPWTGFTAILRMKALPNIDTLDRLFDIEIRNGDVGLREKIYIGNDNTIELDNADTTVTTDVQDWHVYRITMEGSIVSIYVDEEVDPILSGVTTNSTSSYELKIADCSGASQGALVDWFIWTLDGAFAPGSGPDIPNGLNTGLGGSPWAIYDASVLPQDTMFGGSCNEPGPNFSETIVEDPDIADNTLLDYLSADDESKQAYKITPEPWTGFTLVTRMKGYPGIDTLDRLFDFEIRNGDSGLREKVYINYDNSVELDNADTTATFDVSDWHLYRITMSGAEVSIYVDENPDPILSGITTNSTSSYELKVADCSGATQGALVDYITWTLEGAYAPGEGPAIPAGLSQDFTVNTEDVAIQDIGLKAFPNPFLNNTNFLFQLEQSANVELKVVDLMGKVVDTVVDSKLSAGQHNINYPTRHLDQGIYIYTIAVDGKIYSNKIMKLGN